jgi:hypothetical protein
MDINHAIPEGDHQPMDFDLNEVLDLNEALVVDLIIPQVEDEMGIDQKQVSVTISAGNFMKSDSSTQGVLDETVEGNKEINAGQSRRRWISPTSRSFVGH